MGTIEQCTEEYEQEAEKDELTASLVDLGLCPVEVEGCMRLNR